MLALLYLHDACCCICLRVHQRSRCQTSRTRSHCGPCAGSCSLSVCWVGGSVAGPHVWLVRRLLHLLAAAVAAAAAAVAAVAAAAAAAASRPLFVSTRQLRPSHRQQQCAPTHDVPRALGTLERAHTCPLLTCVCPNQSTSDAAAGWLVVWDHDSLKQK